MCANGYCLSPEWSLVFVTAVLAIFTWLLWRSTGTLARESKKSADATLEHLEATAQRQLRAYVFMELIEIEREHQFVMIPSLPQMAPYRATYKNSGQTPAYDVQIEAATFLTHPEFDSDASMLPFPDDANVSRGTIAPGAAIYQSYRDRLDDNQLQLLRDGTRRLFFAGVISYRDAFSQNRRTVFRLMRQPGTHDFIACVGGNDSD